MAPWHDVVGAALQHVHRGGDVDAPVQQQPVAGLLEHPPGQDVGAEAFFCDDRLAVAQDGLAFVVGQPRPHQLFGEVLRRIDQHHPLDPLRPRQRRQQRHPAAHGRADRDHRPLKTVDQGDGVLAPAADGGLLPVAA
uniref:Transcriptional regulator n=1 Tax=Parastrongyloides trichosuri TaxID=131310 RepID=A0A0N4ZLJ3_PARTI